MREEEKKKSESSGNRSHFDTSNKSTTLPVLSFGAHDEMVMK